VTDKNIYRIYLKSFDDFLLYIKYRHDIVKLRLSDFKNEGSRWFEIMVTYLKPWKWSQKHFCASMRPDCQAETLCSRAVPWSLCLFRCSFVC